MCECLHLGDDVVGALDKVQVGDSQCLDPLYFADDMAMGPYRQGSRVGCAGISEHGLHLLRDGHMGDGGGRRWLAWWETLADSIGRPKVGGKEELKFKKLNFDIQHQINISCDHVHT